MVTEWTERYLVLLAFFSVSCHGKFATMHIHHVHSIELALYYEASNANSQVNVGAAMHQAPADTACLSWRIGARRGTVALLRTRGAIARASGVAD